MSHQRPNPISSPNPKQSFNFIARILRTHLHKNLLRLMFAQRQVVAAYLDFHRIAEWGEADQFNRSPHQQAHFEQATAVFGRHFDFGDGGGGADGQGRQRLTGGGHSSGHQLFVAQRLHQDGVSQFYAEAETNVADLADEVGLLAEKFDLLVFAEAHLAEAMGNFGRGGKLFDPAGGTHPQLAEWTDERLFTTRGGLHGGRLFAHLAAR